MRTRDGPLRPIHQARPGQPITGVTGDPGVQGLARHPELGHHHGLLLTTPDRENGAVPLLDNGQLHQSQSRPPLTVQQDRDKKADQADTCVSSIRWDCRVKHQPGLDRCRPWGAAEFASMGIE